ncbi:hypothetical protein [Pseudomonas sp. 5P_3.1_Bac2]|uniref:hypothetical protein n=1 Tax=Pseudomonas sp. 5P_3.1_Bac2 TaxID=2971617 RepID=UPI0021C914DB|nr:hypothetical protein [Pseudomonas sp. 5P_3.1_Bac2]MCU1717265.1 hypothetical protein [Pseudomonas sp. 5P_3.1_Bac2]
MKTLRVLSDVEATFHYLHAMANGSTQVVTALRVRGNFDSNTLSARLTDWAARHAVLNIAVQSSHTDTEQEQLHFTAQPYQAKQLSVRHEHQWFDHPACFSEELNTPLHSAWQWRLSAVIQAGALYLYFTRSHVISDAFSTRQLLQSLLEILLWNVTTAPLTPLIPNRVGSPLNTPSTAPESLPTAAPGPAPEALRHCTRTAISERQTRIHRRLFDRTLSASIMTACKRRGLSLNECFATALALSYASCLGSDQVELYTAISSRRYFTEELADGLGCNIHVLACQMPLTALTLDSQAVRYRSAMSKAGTGWAPSTLAHPAIKAQVEQLCAAEHFRGPCITNSGNTDFTSAICQHVDFVETAVNRNVANYSVVLHLSSFRGRLQILYSYATPAMSDALVKEIDYALMTHLGLLDTSLPAPITAMGIAL